MLNYNIIRPENHDQWLAERAKGIGSSDAGTIMGVSPFSSPKKLYQLRKGILPPIKETDAMFNGHCFELALAEWFARKAGAVIDPNSVIDWLAVDKEHPWRRVSPDRLWWPVDLPEGERTEENARILEIKTTSKYYDTDNIPDYWYCQVQYQMGVMGHDWCAIVWMSTFGGRADIKATRVDFNPNFFKTMISRIDEFWNENLIKGVEPEASTADDYASVNPFKGSLPQACEEAKELIQQIKSLKEEGKNTDDRLKPLEEKLKEYIGANEGLSDENGKVLVTWKEMLRKDKFDEKGFAQKYPQLYDQFKVAQPTARILKIKN